MSTPLSYVSTPLVGGYMYEALPDRLRKLAQDDGDREAFVYYDSNWTREVITRRQLHDRSIKLARVLVADGLQHKATVGFCMANSINMLVANMAVVCAGGIPFYMGTNLKDGSDVISVMNEMKCELFIIDTDGSDANWTILERLWPEASKTSVAVPSLKTIICNGNIGNSSTNRKTLSSLFVKCPDEHVKLPEVQPEDTLAVFCTSGTTGQPKDVLCTHFCLFNWTIHCIYLMDISGKDRFFNDRTFSWVVGYPRTYLTEGTTRIFVDPRLTTSGKYTEQVADVIEKEKCDVMVTPNYIAVDLMERLYLSPKFQQIRTMICAGERVPKTHTDLRGNFCRNFVIFYGTTESGGIVAFSSENNEDYEDGIVGKPAGGVEIKLIDKTGSVVPRGTMGELCVRVPWRFTGYYGNEATFRACVDDSNWFHTGDMAHIRPDGNIVIDGRQKEFISMKTNKFFPWSIEQAHKKMPGAKNAFAIGVPDKRSFEAVCACVVPKEGVSMTVDDVRKFCDDVFMAESSSMVITTKPSYHVVLQSVPLTKSGKVNRMGIAKIAREALGL